MYVYMYVCIGQAELIGKIWGELRDKKIGKSRRRGCQETTREGEERLSKENGGTKGDRAGHIRKKSSVKHRHAESKSGVADAAVTRCRVISLSHNSHKQKIR